MNLYELQQFNWMRGIIVRIATCCTAEQGADVGALSVEHMSPSAVLRCRHVPADEREEVDVAVSRL